MTLIERIQDAIQRRGYSTTRTYRTPEGWLEVRDADMDEKVRIVVMDEEAREVELYRLTNNDISLGSASFAGLPAAVVAMSALEILNYG